MSAILLMNENGINSKLNMSVPAMTKAPLSTATTIATQNAGIKALNEFATPAGTDSGILICQLCLTV